MNRKTLLTLMGLGLAAVGILAYGTWHCLGWMMDRQMTHGNFWTGQTWPALLKLSDEQRSKIQPLERDFKEDMDRLQNELAKKQIALCQMMMSEGGPDQKSVSQRLNEIGDLQKQKDEKALNHFMALRSVLNPDQQKTLFSTMMRDICQACRQATGTEEDYCGMCKIK